MMDPTRYNTSVRKVVMDGDEYFEARVRELPDVAVYAASFAAAHSETMDVISSLAKLAEDEGRSFPLPQESDESVSGRVTLRLPKFIHSLAVKKAEEQSVSLNTYLVAVISQAVSAPIEGARAGAVENKPEIYTVRLDALYGNVPYRVSKGTTGKAYIRMQGQLSGKQTTKTRMLEDLPGIEGFAFGKGGRISKAGHKWQK